MVTNGTKSKKYTRIAVDEGYIVGNKKIRFLFFKEKTELNVTAWNKLTLLDFIRKNNLRFKEGVIHEDEHWSFYAYKKLEKLSVIDNVTYLYYVTANSIMSNSTNQKRADALFPIVRDWMHCFDEPCRALQVFKALEYFRFFVLPYIPKKKARGVYFRFVRELMSIGYPKIALYWWVNWYHDFRHSLLYYHLIPEAHRAEERKVETS